MCITFTRTWVLPVGLEVWRKGQETGGGYQTPFQSQSQGHQGILAVLVFFISKQFVLHKAEKLLTHEQLCHSKSPYFNPLFTETAQHPHPDAFIFQSNVPEISINKHNPLVIICCYPLKFQQRCCCCFKRINPLVAILSAQMATSSSTWLSQGGNCLTKASLGRRSDSAPVASLPRGGRESRAWSLHNMSPFRLTTSPDCGLTLL